LARFVALPAQQRLSDRRARERCTPWRERADRLLEGHADLRAEARERTTRASRQRIARPHVDGHPKRACREHDRYRDRAAARDERVRTETDDLPERIEERQGQRDERAQQRRARVGIAKRAHRDRAEGDARLGHEPTLAPATT